MEMSKSTRHSRITGELGEYLTLYLFSKHGFECVRVDHTGIDIIAVAPRSRERLGISVKSRSRNIGKEDTSLVIEKKQFELVRNACREFDCHPYFGLFIDAAKSFRLYLLPMSKLLDHLGSNKSVHWKMRAKAIKEYEADPDIRRWELSYEPPVWGDKKWGNE